MNIEIIRSWVEAARVQMRVGVWMRIYADMRGACADGHRHARTCAKHVWILAH